jgi:hypothetical protein
MKIEEKKKLIEAEQQYFKETKCYKARLKWEKAKKLNPDTPCPPECQRIVPLSNKKNKKRFRPDEVERYLKVYRLREQGKKWDDVIRVFGRGDDKGSTIETLRPMFIRDYNNAKEIIKNLEEGKGFPIY